MHHRHSRATAASAGLLALGLLGLACGSTDGPYQLARNAPASSDLGRLVLLPMNFDRTPSPALAPGTELMGDRVRAHLEGLGFEVVAPRMSTTLKLWKRCTEEVEGIAHERGQDVDETRYELARSDLVRRTLERWPADGAVAGTIMVRPGRYTGKNLRWDGVSRKMSIDISDTNMPVLTLRGQDLGVSLRTSVFDASGRKIFERYVGIEPLRRFELDYPRLVPIQRNDLFQDETLLNQVVTQSFQPWLAPATHRGR